MLDTVLSKEFKLRTQPVRPVITMLRMLPCQCLAMSSAVQPALRKLSMLLQAEAAVAIASCCTQAQAFIAACWRAGANGTLRA